MFGMSKKEVFRYGVVGVLLGLALWALNGFETGASARPHFQNANLTIARADGTKVSFSMEVANSVNEQSYGLMYVKALAEDRGMIFPYNPPHDVAFWMKNTLIPLDMLFVRPDGKIGLIVAEARPLDVLPISSQGAVAAVIEIKGGEAKKAGIAVGDKVDSSVIHIVP